MRARHPVVAAQLDGRLPESERSHWVLVTAWDQGPGIPTEARAHLFDPFYRLSRDSESRDGTGLGLYISRELCESNQARLDYRPSEHGGSCFRITFAHPRKLS